MGLAVQREKAGRGQRDEGQNAGAAEAGDIAHQLLEPARPERIGGVGGAAQREQDALIEGAGLPL
jgi:hypothetical protein